MFLFISACGFYRLTGTQRQLPRGYHRIFVQGFENNTQIPGLESYFKEALIDQLQLAQDIRVTGKKEEAEVLASGTLEKVSHQLQGLESSLPSNYLPKKTVLAESYVVTLRVHLKLTSTKEGTTLHNHTFSGERAYKAPFITAIGLNTLNALYAHSEHHHQIQLLAKEMMAKAYNYFTENF